MTMHMIRGVNTSRTKKVKKNKTKANLARWEKELVQFNKTARQQNEPKLTLDQYINYIHGKPVYKPKIQKDYTPTVSAEYRSDSHIPSNDLVRGNTHKKESIKYTGDYVIGIATLHKSNAVPVSNPKYAQEISSMIK